MPKVKSRKRLPELPYPFGKDKFAICHVKSRAVRVSSCRFVVKVICTQKISPFLWFDIEE